MRKLSLAVMLLLLPSCNSPFNLFHGGFGPEKDPEHVERERQTADALNDTTRDIAQNGVEANGRNSLVANSLANDLTRSLGAPQQKIDYQNDGEVKYLRGESQRKTAEFQAKEKKFQDTIENMAAYATNMTVGGGVGGTLLLAALGFLWRNRKQVIKAKDELMQEKEQVTQFAKGGVVGSSQVKATFEHGIVAIKEIAKTDKDAALNAAYKLMSRDTINLILRNGSEAVGGSTNLEETLTSFKDDIEQNLLNRPLYDPKVLIHS